MRTESIFIAVNIQLQQNATGKQIQVFEISAPLVNPLSTNDFAARHVIIVLKQCYAESVLENRFVVTLNVKGRVKAGYITTIRGYPRTRTLNRRCQIGRVNEIREFREGA